MTTPGATEAVTPEQRYLEVAQKIVFIWRDRGGKLAPKIAEAIAAAYAAGLRSAADLHDSIDPASDDERQHGSPGAGAMGAIIEYRDRIRSLLPKEEGK